MVNTLPLPDKEPEAVVAVPLWAICPQELKPNNPIKTRKDDFLIKEINPFDN